MYNIKIIIRLTLLTLVLCFPETMLLSSAISIPANKVTIRSIVLDHSGVLWVATFGKGLWKMQNNLASQVYDNKIQQPHSMINTISISQNYLWIATAGKGCVAYNLATKCFDKIPQINGFDRLHAFINTSTGKTLIGSVGSGSAILIDNKWEAMNKNAPISRKWVNCFAEWNNQLWIGTSTDLYSVSTDKINKNWRPKSKAIRNGINCLLADDEQLLVGTTANGIYAMKRGGRAKHLHKTYGSIYQILKWKNTLWASGQFGLWMLSTDSPTLIEEYKFKTPKSLAIDSNGNLIIGTIDGKLILTSDGKNFKVAMEITANGLEKTSK